MSGIAVTEAVSPLHSYEAIKDEARLIQDSETVFWRRFA
jgi:hypothetical protein